MLVDLKLQSGTTVTWEGTDELAAARGYVDCHRDAVVVATRPAHETGIFVGGADRILEPGDRGHVTPMPIGTYVRLAAAGMDRLDGAEGTVEGHVDGNAQVLLSKPRDVRGTLTHVPQSWLTSIRPPRR